MRYMKFPAIVTLALTVVFVNVAKAGEEAVKSTEEELKLVIVGFTDESNMKNAGAEVGDVILKYAGEEIHTIKGLGIAKEAVQTPTVDVVLLRGEEEITLNIPKGFLGVYIKEIAPDYPIDEDAVIIEGIGKLEWGIGMENSFLAAVYRVDEKFGKNVSYEDIVGLSGYGFRLHFFGGWCPSSPDATCGKDVGSGVLNKLGYKFDVFLSRSLDISEELEEMAKTDEEIRAIMMKNIDSGWPVIAIDLIQVPEWGIVTGYQKNGEEFFCRTFFDMTNGYEIAQKMPWVVYAITGKDEVDLLPEYRNSLSLAKELYNTEKYDNYFSGLKASEEWIRALQDEESFEGMNDSVLAEVRLANWWIYYSLLEARNIVKQYLLDNKEKFGVQAEIIDQLAGLYGQEVDILKSGFENVPSPHTGEPLSEWTSEIREKQIETMKSFLEIERGVNNILKQI